MAHGLSKLAKLKIRMQNVPASSSKISTCFLTPPIKPYWITCTSARVTLPFLASSGPGIVGIELIGGDHALASTATFWEENVGTLESGTILTIR